MPFQSAWLGLKTRRDPVIENLALRRSPLSSSDPYSAPGFHSQVDYLEFY